MKIRAHHILCMQGFQGYGYSALFSKNMSEIIIELKDNPDKDIKIITECDEICKCCPHKKHDICKNFISNFMIKILDKKVLKKLKIESGSSIKAKDIKSITNEVFKTKKRP